MVCEIFLKEMRSFLITLKSLLITIKPKSGSDHFFINIDTTSLIKIPSSGLFENTSGVPSREI